MDRRVKERLIGASILVALVVLVVPELLSGPKPNAAPAPSLPAAAPEPIRNVTLDLSTSKAPADSEAAEPPAPPAASSSAVNAAGAQNATVPGAAASETASAAAPAGGATSASAAASSSAPSGSAPASSVPSGAPGPAARPAKPERTASRASGVESAASSPTSTGPRSWSVQLGSFASRANAENLTRQVKGQGFAVFVLPGGSGSAVRYRVRVGPLADRESAERMAAKLKSMGHVGSLVAPAA
jgi:DedD protein